MNNRLKIGLALGGGSALGFAHVGVLKVLKEYGIKPDYVAGTSMGSVVGALYCSGHSIEELVEIAKNFNFKEIRQIQVKSLWRTGLFNSDKLIDYINDNSKVFNIENMVIPFCCNAVDLYTGKEYVFTRGNVGEAVRASTAIPGVFTPYEKNGKLLVDGGVANNLPYDIASKMGAEFIIAVNVKPCYQQKDEVANITQIISSSFSIMQDRLEKEKTKKREDIVDSLISIESHNDSSDYSQEAIVQAIELGEKVARENIDKILKKLEKENLRAMAFGKRIKNSHICDEIQEF